MEVEHNIKCDIRIDDGTKEISEKNIWKCQKRLIRTHNEENYGKGENRSRT